MAKQRETVEFRYYGILEMESVLALLGEDSGDEYEAFGLHQPDPGSECL